MTADSSVFETTADYEQTLLDYYQQAWDRWVGAPAKVLWDDYRGRFGIIIVLIYVFMGTVAIPLVPEPSVGQGGRLVSPFQTPEHILGTDDLGRDMLSLMVHATPDMLIMIVAGAIFGNFIGVTLGLVSGYKGGTVDKVIMTIADTAASLPGIPLLIILAVIIQPTNPFLVGIVLNIQGWAGNARGIRSQVLPLASKEHVEAAIVQGQPTSSLLVKEIVRHLRPYIVIGLLGGAVGIVDASVGLYFLGVLPFTVQNWGVVLNYAYSSGAAMYSLQAAHWLFVPLVVIVGLNLGLTMLAQAFDQVFNPRVRARHIHRKARGSIESEREVTGDSITSVQGSHFDDTRE
jgi:peptide/nickel transport system permease protein